MQNVFMIINKNCFFFAADSGLICWDFKRHKQFEMSPEHAARLVSLIYASEKEQNHALDQDLIDCNILVPEPQGEVDWGWDILSKIFHFGTRSVPIAGLPENEQAWAERYLAHCHHVLDSTPPSTRYRRGERSRIKLPELNERTPFERVMASRHTVRSFLNKPVTLEAVSHLLEFTLGFMPSRELKVNCRVPTEFNRRRCSPSGGGLNATEGYLYAKHVEGIEPGIYYYDPACHELYLCADKLPLLGSVLAGQHFVNDLPVGLFLTSRFDKYWWKYPHSRAYRMALIEVGHVAQTFQLVATDQGLSTWLTGAMDEDSLDSILKIENPAEQVLFFVGAGFSDGSPIPKTLAQLMDGRTGRGAIF
ncbi:SagB/ThcOx family dehydrogenase [Pseudomonas putida]|uniref:SagB/ThcOx family dehydrogenase n=1 Tax=Pseudomonas putida TaxID=303 RepID=UPI00301E2145